MPAKKTKRKAPKKKRKTTRRKAGSLAVGGRLRKGIFLGSAHLPIGFKILHKVHGLLEHKGGGFWDSIKNFVSKPRNVLGALGAVARFTPLAPLSIPLTATSIGLKVAGK
jgi:hypothetical protein